MKVAILSHFGGFQDSYALHVGWLERAKLLDYFNVDFDFLVNEKCNENLYPRQRNCLPNPPSGKPFDYRVKLLTDAYQRCLQAYDVILTADLIYQRKGNFLANNQAARNVAKELKAWWCHWIHSSWVTRPGAQPIYPDNLRFTNMEKSFLVYLNGSELKYLAAMYNTDPRLCRTVYNPKDFRSFNDFHPCAWEICKDMDLINKDVVQIFPHCSTRMDAKGIDGIVNVFAALKRKGKKVAIIFANANSRKVQPELAAKKDWMRNQGLIDKEDFLFTSDFMPNFKPLPRKAVSDIFKVANLFVFASWRETVGNAFQEAKVSGNFLVLNGFLPCLREMGGSNAMFFDSDHKTPGKRDGQTGDFQRVDYLPSKEQYFDHLVEKIIPQIPSRKYLWSFSFEWIWHNQFKPLLEDAYNLSKGASFDDIVKERYPEKKNILDTYNLDQLRRMGIEVVVQEEEEQHVFGA